MRQRTLKNDRERRLWVENDEGLWDWYRQSRLSMTKFVREHRAEIDQVIDNVVNNGRPPHYLKYGG